MPLPASNRVLHAPTFAPGLDGVRGLAILGVLLFHALSTNGALPRTLIERAYYAFFNLGSFGVDVFFALSGFLITRILLHARGKSDYFRTFYIRRFLRIFPAYYAYLMAAGVTLALLEVSNRSSVLLAACFTYLQNWLALVGVGPAQGLEMSFLGHLWSLAIEEQFYFVWPAIVLACTSRQLLWVCLSIIIVTPVLRWWALLLGASDYTVYVNTLTRIDGLMMGAIFAISPGLSATARRHFWKLLGAALVYLLTVRLTARVVRPETAMAVGFHGGVAALSALLVTAATTSNRVPFISAVLESGPLRLLGRYSYGIYLYHWPIMGLLKEPFAKWAGPSAHPIASHLAFLTTSGVLIALCVAISWWALEQRFLALKDRFAPSPARLPALADSGRA